MPTLPEALDIADAHLYLDARLLAMLHNTSLAIAQLRDPVAMARAIVEVTENLLPVDARILVAVYRNDEWPRMLAHSARGYDLELLPRGEGARIEAAIRENMPAGVIAQVLREGRVVRSGNAAELAGFVHAFAGVRSCLCVPAITHGAVVGAINVESTQADLFGEREEIALRIMANQLAVAIENVRLLEDARAELALRRQADERLQVLNERLSRQASHDGLTGLINRGEFHRRLVQALQTARKVGAVHALCVLDLDRFKSVNDAAGHSAGDAMLGDVANSLSRLVRRNDIVARIGGDEFAVLLDACTCEQASRFADTLSEAISAERCEVKGRELRLTASIGIASIDADCLNVEQALSEAGAACHAAKLAGGNRVHTADSAAATIERVKREDGVRVEFERAVAVADGIRLDVQSIVSLPGAVAASRVEVLARLRTADGRILFPHEFLGAVERFRLAPVLDRQVLERVVDWLVSGATVDGKPMSVNVNLSGQSLGDPLLLEWLERQIAQGRFDATRLCFEITETAIMADLNRTLHFMERLRQQGCGFAIDDFGAGFSSMSYLRNLPADWVKIDASFVHGIADSEHDRALVAMMNDIAHRFGMRSVAEGVETARDLQALVDLGLDGAQGFYFERPYPLPA